MYEARLLGSFLVMIALGILLRSNFSFHTLLLLGAPFLIAWFFKWDEAKYERGIKQNGSRKNF